MPDFPQMYSKYGFPSFKIRKFHLYPAVETPRPQESLVKALRPVGRRQYDHSLGGIETVHLREQLVQGLFPFIVAAHGIVTPFADSVDLVYEDDARGFLSCLLEQVPDFRCTHAHKHLDKL